MKNKATPDPRRFAHEAVALYAQAQAGRGIRLDASETTALERELTSQHTEIIAKFGPLKAVIVAPLREDTPPYAEEISYPVLTDVGRSKIVANDATDIPMIGFTLDDNLSPVYTVAGAYPVTWIQDITPDGISRIGNLRRATSDANAREVDRVCMIGFPEANLGGFFNNPSVPEFTRPNAGTPWTTATAAQILEDLRAWEEFVIATGGDTLYPNMLVLPGTEVSLLTDTAGTGTDTSIWNLFQKNSQGMQGDKITEWSIERSAYATDPVLGERRGVMYHRDPDVLGCEVPLTLEELPPQASGLTTVVIMVSRVGGVIWTMPAHGAYSAVD